MTQGTCSKGQPLAESTRDRLWSLLDELGEPALIRLLDVSRPTLYRAIGGLGVRRGTRALIEQRLVSHGGGNRHGR